MREIAKEAFCNTNLIKLYLPNLEILGEGSLGNINMFSNDSYTKNNQFSCLYAPNLKIIKDNAFVYLTALATLDLPNLVEIGKNAFIGSGVSRAEFSRLETTQSLPVVENSIIALPSSFKECTEDTTGRNYKIYGTDGTYAQKWAKENNHTFVVLNSTNAILEDLPTEYYGLGEVLSPDVVGFNKTYQWYSNTTPDNINGIAIEGATGKEFNPADYPQAKYYYCVVTSRDGNNEPIEIRTGVTTNTTLDSKTILSTNTSQIRFTRNDDGSFANKFDIRTRAIITDEIFAEFIAESNSDAEQKITDVGFVYMANATDFSPEIAQKVAMGENVSGYAKAPVKHIQDADGYYMFTCLITDIPVEAKEQSVTAYAYICVDGKWYFFDEPVTTNFGELYDEYYPIAAEKYGW